MLDKSRFRLKGHTLMAVAPNMSTAFGFIVAEGFDQFQIHTDDNGEIRIGVPLKALDRDRYKWLYHRMQALEKPPEPPKGGPTPPKGSPPPQGGSPAAGQTPVETEVLKVAA